MLNKIDYIIENIKTYDPKVNSELINEAFTDHKSKQNNIITCCKYRHHNLPLFRNHPHSSISHLANELPHD